MLDALNLHSIQKTQREAQHGLRQCTAEDPRRDNGHRNRREPAQRNERSHRQATRREHGRNDCSRRHGQGVDDVVGGDDAGAITRFAFVLQKGIQGNTEQAPSHGQAGQIGEDAPAARSVKEGGHTHQLRTRHAPRACQMQIDRKASHRQRRERNVPRADLAVQKALGEHRSRADADREQCEHQRHHAFVGKEDVLGQHWQSGHDGRTKQPEP